MTYNWSGIHITYASIISIFFSYTDTSTPSTYTLSLHDALPIYNYAATAEALGMSRDEMRRIARNSSRDIDRKSTRLNSSHVSISYAVFCLKKKKKRQTYDYSTPFIPVFHRTSACQDSKDRNVSC